MRARLERIFSRVPVEYRDPDTGEIFYQGDWVDMETLSNADLTRLNRWLGMRPPHARAREYGRFMAQPRENPTGPRFEAAQRASKKRRAREARRRARPRKPLPPPLPPPPPPPPDPWEDIDLPDRDNPGEPRDLQRAVDTFEGFNDYEIRGYERFAKEIRVPARLPFVGPCKWVTYRSNKWNDGTHDYIHTIESFPSVRLCVPGEDFDEVSVPARVRNATTLAQIGTQALGAGFENDAGESELRVPRGSQWYWSPSAKALYLIAKRERLVAVLWGGRLDVEPRGIVG